MWRQPPIWEPQGTKFRPYSIIDADLFLHRKVLRKFVRPASLIGR